MMYPFTLHSTWVSTVHVSRSPTTWQTMCRVEYLKRYLYLLLHWRTIPLSTLICVKVPWWTFSWRWLFCSYKLFLSNSNLCSMRKLPRDCAWRNKDHVCGLRKNNISIEIYWISRLNYYISFWVYYKWGISRSAYDNKAYLDWHIISHSNGCA